MQQLVSGCLHKYEQTYKKADLTIWICGNVRNAVIAALIEITLIEMTAIAYWAFLTLSWSWKIVFLDKLGFSKKIFFFFMYRKSLYKVFTLLSGKAINFSKFNSRNKKIRCDICSLLITHTPEPCWWRHSGVFNVNF